MKIGIEAKLRTASMLDSDDPSYEFQKQRYIERMRVQIYNRMKSITLEQIAQLPVKEEIWF